MVTYKVRPIILNQVNLINVVQVRIQMLAFDIVRFFLMKMSRFSSFPQQNIGPGRRQWIPITSDSW